MREENKYIYITLETKLILSKEFRNEKTNVINLKKEQSSFF